jgi:tRNA 2-thiouridine synthesizing protein A
MARQALARGGSMSDTPTMTGEEVPQADAVLRMTGTATAPGTTCAVLTPSIKAALRELWPGAVLEVQVDDPDARQDVASWCRLSGNELVALVEEPAGLLTFYVRKKIA